MKRSRFLSGARPSRSAPLALALAVLPALAGDTTAQDYDEVGPHPVGWRDEPLPFENGTVSDTVLNRIYYPSLLEGQGAAADPAPGPYPLVCLIHGHTVAPQFYDVLSAHVASRGYVVASVGGMANADETYGNLARETKQLADWVTAESADPSSPYAGLVLDGPLGVIGSSRGGGACELFVGMEPRVRAAALLEPSYIGGGTALGNLASWDGAWLFVAGELDSTNPPNEVRLIRNRATGAARRVYVEIQGAGHAGALDPDTIGLPNDPLPHLEQLRLHSRLTIAFLEAELRGLENAYHAMIGEGAAGEPLEHECTSRVPILWALEATGTPGSVALGVGGDRDAIGLIAVAAGAASISTPFGILGLEPATTTLIARASLGAPGTLEGVLAVPPSLAGLTVHVQALALGNGGAFTRVDSLVLP